MKISIFNTVFIILFLLSASAQEKPPLTPSDYDQWEFFGARKISADGKWLAYEVRRVDKQNELRILNLQTDSLKIVTYGTNPSFSNSSKWLTYQITPSKEEKEKLKKAKKPVQNKAEVVELANWEKQTFDKIASSTFDEAGNYLALKAYPEGKKKGTNLLIIDLEKETQLNLGNVKAFAWAEPSPLLALIIETASNTGNGVQLYNAQTGVLKMLDASTAKYNQLSWRKDATDLAVLCTKEEKQFSDQQHILISWTNLNTANSIKKIFDPTESKTFPSTARISEHYKPKWAKNNNKIYFEIQAREAKEAEKDSTDKKSEEKISDVQVWHSKALQIYPQQKSRYKRNQQRGILSQWNLDDNSFLRIGTDAMQSISIVPNDKYALETDHSPYPFGLKFGRYFEDLYLTNLSNGERKRIGTKVRYHFGASPLGNYVLYFQDEDYWVYHIQTNTHTNITESIDAIFVNKNFDYPVKQYPPFRIAGWEDDDKSILIYDEFDIWRVTPNGKSHQKLTNGASANIIYRYQKLDPKAESINLRQPIYCQMRGKYTKKTGFAQISSKGDVTELIYSIQSLYGLTKAQEADVLFYLAQDFANSPNIFVTDSDFKQPEQKTFINSFQKDYAWGTSELIDYKSTAGKDLQAALFYPANYDPMKKYPMIVYTYEIVSNWVNRYFVPSEQSLYNFSTFTSEGYFVLAPDIVYEAREPGKSAVAAVEGAVQTVIQKGLIDPERIGLVGHSWGGYQATYIPTQTDIFAASVAGAPITNFLSFMGAIHWNPGLPEVDHWETGQARMEVPYWEDFEAHVRNSPAAFVHKLTTPMLMAFGDSDGVVDWHQGVEFYNFARRAGNEEFVLLVYPGEDHGIAGEEHRKDYNQRIREWFSHYLKGEPAKPWMREGVSFKEREKLLKKN